MCEIPAIPLARETRGARAVVEARSSRLSDHARIIEPDHLRAGVVAKLRIGLAYLCSPAVKHGVKAEAGRNHPIHPLLQHGK